MKVSKTRRLKLLKDMEASKEIHSRGHYTVSERVLVNAIVNIIQNQREVEVPVEFDPVINPLNDEVLSVITG